MTAIHWAAAVSGDFSDASDWAGGVTPGPSDDAVLDPAGAPFTATASKSETVAGLQTAANATLLVAKGIFRASAGSDGGVQAGQIQVADGAAFAFAGTLANGGTVSLDGTGDATSLLIGPPGGGGTISLSGGGQVLLNGTGDRIRASGTFATLDNVNDTIVGGGRITSSTAHGLSLMNGAAGVIEAAGPTPLTIRSAGALTNDGLIEATGGGVLVIRHTLLANEGRLHADLGASIKLIGAAVFDGVLDGPGAFRCRGVQTIFSGLTLAADVHIQKGDALTLEGEIVDDGAIQLSGGRGPGSRNLVVDENGATLDGYGAVKLGGAASRIVGSGNGDLLVNDATIRGAGQIGAGTLALVNGVRGKIVGDRRGALTIDTGPNAFINAGEVEAVGRQGTGLVILAGAVDNTGTLRAEGGTLIVDGDVSGTEVAWIDGGSLVFEAAFSQNVAFASGGRLGGALTLAHSQSYGGTVSGFTAGETIDLADIGFVSAGEATYAGGGESGVLTVTDGVHTATIALDGHYLGSSFSAASDGDGGVIVTVAKAHRFAAAMAGHVPAAPPHAAPPFHTGEGSATPGILARPA